jgi:phosphate transport system protein
MTAPADGGAPLLGQRGQRRGDLGRDVAGRQAVEDHEHDPHTGMLRIRPCRDIHKVSPLVPHRSVTLGSNRRSADGDFMALVTDSVNSQTAPAGDLAEIDRQVIRLFAMVSEGLAAVTTAFLAGDRKAASDLVAEDPLIDKLQCSTESLVEGLLTQPSVHTEDQLRMLVTVLHIVPELERSGDLVEHIALRTSQGLAQISPRARGLVEQMGEIGVVMWRIAGDAYADRDPGAAARLREFDDRLDDLHVRLSSELGDTATNIPVAIEMGLVARFYERLGDHAVNVARRVRYLVPDLARREPSR